MKKALALALASVTLTGCSPAMLSEQEALARLENAHDECSEGLLRSEILEPTLDTHEYGHFLSYRASESESKILVECVSNELLGSDLTEREFTRNELLAIEDSFEGEAPTYLFDTRYLDNWNKPFEFYRYDGNGFAAYYFIWYEGTE